jgi:hypothetical protein
MLRVRVTSETADDPPDGFDAVTYVSTSLARVPWGWEVEVVLELSVEEAMRRVPSTLAELVDHDGATVLRMRQTRSTGPRASSRVSDAASRSADPTSCATACGRSESDWPARPRCAVERVPREDVRAVPADAQEPAVSGCGREVHALDE